ncbi:MAG: hypothetical protein NPMRIOTA_50028 [Nitrosopumilales archaeon]|nr:MAG: hypothetical protein NPMRIOTA_50028 [Nitrosopumilales archaeon]
MQYFTALKIGEKRVKEAREYLNKLANGRAMPALALRDNKTNVWEPVGEENFYAVIDESSGFVLTDSSGYIMALCDKNGISKAIVQGVSKEQKDEMVKALKFDNILEFKGKVQLPV